MSLCDRTNTYMSSKPKTFTSTKVSASSSSSRPIIHKSVDRSTRLPNEILASIFLSASSRVPEEDPFALPLVISHVCSRWRRVALHTGRLWSYIALSNPVWECDLALASLWLQRSRSCPLDLVFDFRDPKWSPNMEYHQDDDEHSFGASDLVSVLRHFLPHVSRWRHLELLTDTWVPIWTFLRLTNELNCVPLELQTLILMRCNAYLATEGQDFEPSSHGAPVPLFGGTALPKLRNVTLSGVHVDWAASLPVLSNLTRLELKYHAANVMPSWPQYQRILASNPNLQELVIGGWGPQSFEDESGAEEEEGEEGAELGTRRGVIELPALRTFKIHIIHLHHSLRLLAQFKFPALEELVLEDMARMLNSFKLIDMVPLFEWIASSASGDGDDGGGHRCFDLQKLTSLGLCNISAENQLEAFRRWMAQMPHIRELSLARVNKDVVDLLRDPAIFPDLHSIHCSSFSADQISTLAASIQRRTKPSTVHFGRACFDIHDCSSTIQNLRNAGHTIVIDVQPGAEEDDSDDSEEEFWSCEGEDSFSTSTSTDTTLQHAYSTTIP